MAIIDCESSIESNNRRGDELRTMLGFGKPLEQTDENKQARVAPKRRVVGERTLIRDQVGVAP